MAASVSVLNLVLTHKLASVVLIAFTWLIGTIIYRIFFHPLAGYPGPFFGKFTDFYSFYGVYKEKRTKLQYEFLEQYGTPVRFSTNELVFSDVKTLPEIYGQSSNLPEKEPNISNAMSATGAPNILSLVDKVQHARVRRLLSHGFSLGSLLESEAVMAEKVELYISLVFNSSVSDGEWIKVDLYLKTHELYLDIVSRLAFNESFNCMTDETSTALRDVDAFGEVVPPQAFFPGFRYLPFKRIREGFEGLKRLEKFARRCVEKHMQHDKGNVEEKSILSNMFEAFDSDSGTKLTMDEIVENTIIFLVGGSSTTSLTFLYLVWECGRRPEVIKKLVAEIRTAFPERDRMPTYAEASKLKYLSNVIDETLRLWSPLNTGIPRISTGRFVGGRYFKPGAGFSSNPYATARDPTIFPDPHSFIPERWENATAEMRLMSRPFSIGPRNCIGRHLALIGVHLTITRVFQLYDVTIDPSMTEARMVQRDRGVYTPWDETVLVWAKPVGDTANH